MANANDVQLPKQTFKFANVEPAERLIFHDVDAEPGKDSVEAAYTCFRITNFSHDRVAFKIQSNQNTKMQMIAPSCGFLQSGESVESMILWKVQAPDRLSDGQFQVLITPVQSIVTDRHKVWRDLATDAQVQHVVLRSQYVSKADEEEKKQIDVALLIVAFIVILAFFMICKLTCG